MKNLHQERSYHRKLILKRTLIYVIIIRDLQFWKPLPSVARVSFINSRSLNEEVKIMSKKRSPRLQKKLKYELLGLLFVFLAIFGSGASMISDGFFSGSLEYIFRFFLGIWYF